MKHISSPTGALNGTFESVDSVQRTVKDDKASEVLVWEPMPLEVQIVFRPLGFILTLFGLPAALISGTKFSSVGKIRTLGALSIGAIFLGNFGVGVQLVAVAFIIAFSLL